jgi:hypothetical protein
VSSLQKHSGLIDYKNKIREGIKDSVLEDSGFVKIAPYKSLPNSSSSEDPKKFMFSIENLAWNDNLSKLYGFEKGNGDPSTRTSGRVMWFPPYDIKFTDTTALNWDTTNFIGRGEPIYTYNNTERSGTLSFKVIIDYPDYMNDSNIDSDEIMASLAAGAMDYEDYFSTEEEGIIDNKTASQRKNETIDIKETEPDNFNFYFENDSAIINGSYEVGVISSTNYGLNNTWGLAPSTFISQLIIDLTDCPSCNINIKGYASSSGTTAYNLALGLSRANSVKQWFLDNIDSELSNRIKVSSVGEEQSLGTGTVDSLGVKSDRKATVEFEYIPSKNQQVIDSADAPREKTDISQEFKKDIKNRFHREDEYFQKLRDSDVESDKIIYKTIKEKINFFQPAFHSTTPEGFNSRLTFLQQCTRQGPTNKNNKASNLAFGMPPVCILRIGDFYHTKIIINSLNITYDPLVWDLNPEGVGVQPMIANIEMAFKFIGGSSLNGPINKLQNAVSFNYFGNTQIYDLRSDRFIRKNGGLEYIAGLENISGREEIKSVNEIDGTGVVLPKDQMEQAEIEMGTPDAEIPTTIADEITLLKGIAWSVTWYENQFILTYSSPIGEPFSALTGTYIAKLQTIDADFVAGNVFRNILTLTIDKRTLDTGSELSNDHTPLYHWDENPYETYPPRNFKLTITGNGIEPIIENGDIPVV